MTFPKRVAENWISLAANSLRDLRIPNNFIGFLWDNNATSLSNSATQRLRQIAGPGNYIGRYIMTARTDEDTSPATNTNAPSNAAASTYFGAGNLDDPTLSPYIHNAEPLSETGLTIAVTTDATYAYYERSSGSWPSATGLGASDAGTFAGFSNAGNNGMKKIISLTSTILTVEKGSSTAETKSGISVAYRHPQYGNSNSWWTRRSQENWLDYVFGAVGADGVRADLTDSWVKEKYFWGDPFTLFCHDTVPFSSLSGFAGTDARELLYATSNDYEVSWYNYFSAFKDRLLTPRNAKVVINSGQHKFWKDTPGGMTWPEIMAVIDGMYTENFMTEGNVWWHGVDWQPCLYRNALEIQWLSENNKVAAICAQYSYAAFRIWLSSSPGGTNTFKVNGSRLDLTLNSILNSYSIIDKTMDEVFAWLDTFSANVAYDTGYANSCSGFTAGCPAELLYHMASASTLGNSSNKITVYFAYAPRQAQVTLAAHLFLAGPASDSEIYWNACGSSPGTSQWNDLYYIHDLIGEPDFVTQPKVQDAHYALHGMAVAWDVVDTGDCYYRLFTNGIAILNWSGGAKTINANNAKFGAHSNWYDLRNYSNVLTPPRTGLTTSTDVTLPDKSGTICLWTV